MHVKHFRSALCAQQRLALGGRRRITKKDARLEAMRLCGYEKLSHAVCVCMHSCSVRIYLTYPRLAYNLKIFLFPHRLLQ